MTANPDRESRHFMAGHIKTFRSQENGFREEFNCETHTLNRIVTVDQLKNFDLYFRFIDLIDADSGTFGTRCYSAVVMFSANI